MKTNKHQIETKFDRELDPFADHKIFPGQWDLSDMPEMQGGQDETAQFQAEYELEMPDHGLAPGAMDEWHLAAYFEDHPARHGRGWSAY